MADHFDIGQAWDLENEIERLWPSTPRRYDYDEEEDTDASTGTE